MKAKMDKTKKEMEMYHNAFWKAVNLMYVRTCTVVVSLLVIGFVIAQVRGTYRIVSFDAKSGALLFGIAFIMQGLAHTSKQFYNMHKKQ